MSDCTLILHATSGTCPDCGREVGASGWNQRHRDGCYWCGSSAAIACTSRCGCIA